VNTLKTLFHAIAAGLLRWRELRRLRREIAQLKGEVDRLHMLAYTDELTKAQLRRHYLEVVARYRTTRVVYTLVLCDIDHFKRVNDTHGHDKGDEVLVAFAARLRAGVRKAGRHKSRAGDVVRWGGEEFILLLPHTDIAGARAVAERVRQSVAHAPLAGLAITASFGVAEAAPGEDPAAVLKRADRALYAAKDGGRNRVCVCAMDGTIHTKND